MYRNCAFTGHRVVGTDLDVALLERVVENLIKRGTEKFYCGMAVGFDLIAAECVLRCKEKYGVRLVACVPYGEQSKRFSDADKDRYEKIIGKCDEVKVFSSFYFNGCMQQRDRYMVDCSDVVICFLRENRGGTYYTVNYARKRGVPLIEL